MKGWFGVVNWYWIPICLSAGACLGVMVMCLCFVAKQSDENYQNNKINNIKYGGNN
jgi:hypothetical protein